MLVEEVRKKSPAAEAGFKAGDVIVKVGDESVETIGEVRSALGDYAKGDKAAFEVLRKGSSMTLTLPIEEKEVGSFYHTSPPDFEHRYLFEIPEPPAREMREFEIQMKELGKEMKEMGKRLKEELKGVGEKVRLEMRKMAAI